MLTDTQKAIFIAALQETGLEAKSARKAGVPLRTIIAEYDEDPGFKEQSLEAIEEFNDIIEEEAIRRAVEGTAKPVFHQGKICGEIIEYSDTLLTKLLQGRRPSVYGDKREISGKNGGPITITIAEFADDHSDIL